MGQHLRQSQGFGEDWKAFMFGQARNKLEID